MSQITNGIRSILSHPIIYNLLQNIMGASSVRKDLIHNHIKPFDNCFILDIGCGTADILKFLPKNIHYWGVDISEPYINQAKFKFNDRGTFICSKLNIEVVKDFPKFDRILALGVLHHLNDDEVIEFFKVANFLLNKNGLLVTIDPCFVSNQNIFSRFLINKDRGQNVRYSDGYIYLAKKVFNSNDGVLVHRKWIPYTHWIMKCHNN